MTDNRYAACRLGEDREVHRADALEAVQQASRSMVEQARRSVDIVSRDLDPRVYDDSELLEALRQLAISGRYARIRVLVRDVDAPVKVDHRLIPLARRLSSYISIRRLHPQDADHNEAFLLVDQAGYLLRRAADRYEAEVCFNDPLRARELAKQFEELWERSIDDPNLRRLHL